MNETIKKTSVLLSILFLVYVSYNRGTQKSLKKINNAGIKQIPVVVQHAEKKEFKDFIEIKGNVSAKNFAHISSKLPGIIENIFVNEGDKVLKDETELFQVEKIKFKKTYEISRHDLELAKCNVNVAQANLERVKVDYNKAEIDYNRFKRLFEKNAITKNELEIQESRFLQTSATLKQTKALLKLSKEQEQQAQAAFEMAEKDLTDTVIKAPINGIITKKFHEAGENIKVGETVLKIEDLGIVEIEAFVPSDFYLKTEPGKTEANLFYGVKKIKTAFISYKSPTIDETARNFEIKLEIENKDKTFVPGMLLDIELVFEKRINVGVPLKSILQKNTGKILYVAENGIARQKKVETGLRTDGWIEILNQNVKENEYIITEGQFIVKHGLPVITREGAN